MRRELLNPVDDELSLRKATSLARDAYALHERGEDTSAPVRAIASIAKKPFADVAMILEGAFGSVRPDSFAQRALVDWSAIPKDLSDPEMLELLERICNPEGGQEFLNEYWVRCLEVNTGNKRVSDLIFWPGEYLGTPPGCRELSPQEILVIALKDGTLNRS